jgi:hypothetical protein
LQPSKETFNLAIALEEVVCISRCFDVASSAPALLFLVDMVDYLPKSATQMVSFGSSLQDTQPLTVLHLIQIRTASLILTRADIVRDR